MPVPKNRQHLALVEVQNLNARIMDVTNTQPVYFRTVTLKKNLHLHLQNYCRKTDIKDLKVNAFVGEATFTDGQGNTTILSYAE